MLLPLYQTLTKGAAIPLTYLLRKRLKKGKEHPERWQEKQGVIQKKRPTGTLIWLHAASVGEAQSALILIEKILSEAKDINVLITSGTLSSANMLEKRLPQNAFHQFAPLDHPDWVEKFLNHWQPELAIWLESEIWPNTLSALKKRAIPAILINARLSPTSFKNWKRFPNSAQDILSAFSHILCQTDKDQEAYKQLGAKNVSVSGNIKYSAASLPFDEQIYNDIKDKIAGRSVWVYASTHASEEILAANLHKKLKANTPDLLTIIIPRHPERGDQIMKELDKISGLNAIQRSKNNPFPQKDTDIYLADTLGELGLFYRLASIAVIGRSFSNDGGGGHNPIEAAQLDCAVLHGPLIQNLQQIYDDMAAMNACVALKDEEDFYNTLNSLFHDKDKLALARENGSKFSQSGQDVLDNVWHVLEDYIKPIIQKQA